VATGSDDVAAFSMTPLVLTIVAVVLLMNRSRTTAAAPTPAAS